ncbi:hypothetical protein P3S67_006614 [Capsicum chacoense]
MDRRRRLTRQKLHTTDRLHHKTINPTHCISSFSIKMVKANKQTTDTAAEMKEMRALIERLFAELNARQDKFDEALLELKASIESLKVQGNGGKGVESAMNALSALQEENKKGRGKITGPKEKQAKGCSKKKNVSLIEDDDDVDVPTVDAETTEEKEMAISMDAVVENSEPYEGCCVTGYHGKRPLTVLMGAGGTSHNFINESLADKLGCDKVPVKPRVVRSAYGKMVTSRVCKDFQLSMQGTVFSLDVYLLPLSSNCDMVLGGEWIKTLEKLVISAEGAEFYLQGTKKFMCFKKGGGGRKRRFEKAGGGSKHGLKKARKLPEAAGVDSP